MHCMATVAASGRCEQAGFVVSSMLARTQALLQSGFVSLHLLAATVVCRAQLLANTHMQPRTRESWMTPGRTLHSDSHKVAQ
jgi:hypothetical protein